MSRYLNSASIIAMTRLWPGLADGHGQDTRVAAHAAANRQAVREAQGLPDRRRFAAPRGRTVSLAVTKQRGCRAPAPIRLREEWIRIGEDDGEPIFAPIMVECA